MGLGSGLFVILRKLTGKGHVQLKISQNNSKYHLHSYTDKALVVWYTCIAELGNIIISSIIILDYYRKHVLTCLSLMHSVGHCINVDILWLVLCSIAIMNFKVIIKI